ncbi:hypothetical protein V2J09_000571, partial [Rumex salicifolius]
FFNLPKTRPIATKGPPSAAYLPLEIFLLQEARSEALLELLFVVHLINKSTPNCTVELVVTNQLLFDFVQTLLLFRCNVTRADYLTGRTALHFAVVNGHILNCNGWLPVDVAKMWGRHWLEPLLSFVELHIVWNMTMEEQKIAAHLANTMSNSLKGRPALGRIFQGKEPPQFVALFEPMIVLKGGLSSGSKLAVKALGVEPYTIDGVALIQISGISTHNSRAVRVDTVEEIYNFTQDDLLTEDTLILDTHAEVFVWVGHTVDPKEKQKAFEMGEKYIALAASLEDLPQQVPLYKITEGNEPCFFTTYFSWDSAKAIV